jgi:hypothetical protein
LPTPNLAASRLFFKQLANRARRARRKNHLVLVNVASLFDRFGGR